MISATPTLFVFEQVSSLKCQNTFYKICAFALMGKKSLPWSGPVTKVKMNFDLLPQHSFIIDFLSSVAIIKTTLIQLRCSMFSCYSVAYKMACQSRFSKITCLCLHVHVL